MILQNMQQIDEYEVTNSNDRLRQDNLKINVALEPTVFHQI